MLGELFHGSSGAEKHFLTHEAQRQYVYRLLQFSTVCSHWYKLLKIQQVNVWAAFINPVAINDYKISRCSVHQASRYGLASIVVATTMGLTY